MVVILRDAALVFWMEYRRYVRTRRYWVLALTTLALGMLLCLIAALVAARIPQAPLRFLGASVYLPATTVGWFAAIASVVHNPLSVRMLQDVYKTRWLSDLYLTELHPLGVVLGRAAATTALTGLILLMLTPAGLWLLQLIGAPLGAWVPIALLALVSYFFGSCLDAYTFRMLALGEEQFGPPQVVRSGYVSMLSLGFLAGWVLASVAIFFPLWNWLARLPLWVFTPPTAPFLLFVGIQGDGWVHALLGALFAVGFTLWVAVAAAQWRDWWSDTAYRLLRWGGTAFWLAFVSVHAAYFAQAFVRDGASAERTLLLALLIVCLANIFLIAPLTSYFGVARRPKPLRFALPYPWGGLVWQWALHWLAAGALYLAVGLASGVWVAPTKWLLWATYFWAAFVLLPQAMSADVWAYFQRCPTPLQGDYAHDYFLNTRGMRASLDALAQKSGSGVLWLAVVLWFLFFAQLVLNFVNRAFPDPALAVAADWISRVHPWYGVYLEWLGGGGEAYLLYSLAWTILAGLVNGRRGLSHAHMALQDLQQWCEQLESERAPKETPKSVA
jgi:hypothetical protein